MSRYGRTMADAYKEVTKYSEEPEVVEAETVAETEPEEVEDLNEVAPPGWEGTVKAMKKHKDIDNPYALSWHMKKKGYKSHKKEEVEKEALDTWHPDPEKDRKTTSMKHTAKAVRQHARRDKPATFAKKKVTPDQIRAILDKQRARRAAQNEEIQFKVKIRDLPPFYVPGRSAGAVKQALRKQLRKPDDIESIERHTTAAKKKDFRLRAQGKEE